MRMHLILTVPPRGALEAEPAGVKVHVDNAIHDESNVVRIYQVKFTIRK